MLAPFGIGLAAFVMAGAITDFVERTGVLRLPFATALTRWQIPFIHTSE